MASSVDGRRSGVTNDTTNATFFVKMVWRNTVSVSASFPLNNKTIAL